MKAGNFPSLFTLVKSSVTVRDAAEAYGVKVGRGGMACCPFHHDRHPSMKADTRFYCFSCHAAGDVIDFVGKLFGLASYDAAVKIAGDFGLLPAAQSAGTIRALPAAPPVPRENSPWLQRRREGACAAALIALEALLKDLVKTYEPAREDDCWDDRFTQALEELPRVSYWIDCLYTPDGAERADAAALLTEGGILDELLRLAEDLTRTEEKKEVS